MRIGPTQPQRTSLGIGRTSRSRASLARAVISTGSSCGAGGGGPPRIAAAPPPPATIMQPWFRSPSRHDHASVVRAASWEDDWMTEATGVLVLAGTPIGDPSDA